VRFVTVCPLLAPTAISGMMISDFFFKANEKKLWWLSRFNENHKTSQFFSLQTQLKKTPRDYKNFQKSNKNLSKKKKHLFRPQFGGVGNPLHNFLFLRHTGRKVSQHQCFSQHQCLSVLRLFL
jgi:hypothetical protein